MKIASKAALGLILVSILFVGLLYTHNDIGITAAKIESDIRSSQKIQLCKSFFSKVLKLLAFQGVWMFLYSRFPLFFPLSGKNKGKSYCTLSSSFAASRLASLLACA